MKFATSGLMMAAVGAFLAAFVIRCIKVGSVPGGHQSRRVILRSEYPAVFWLCILIYGVVAGILLAAGILGATGSFAKP